MNNNELAAKENRHKSKDKIELNQTHQREPIAQLWKIINTKNDKTLLT